MLTCGSPKKMRWIDPYREIAFKIFTSGHAETLVSKHEMRCVLACDNGVTGRAAEARDDLARVVVVKRAQHSSVHLQQGVYTQT